MTAMPIALSAAAGILLGLGYFACLYRTAMQIAGGGGLRAAAATLARFAVAALALWLLALLGAPALLAAFAGFLLARAFALRLAARAA